MTNTNAYHAVKGASGVRVMLKTTSRKAFGGRVGQQPLVTGHVYIAMLLVPCAMCASSCAGPVDCLAASLQREGMKCAHILASAHHAVQGAGGIEDYVQEHVSARMGQQLEAQGVHAAVLLPAALAVRQQHS